MKRIIIFFICLIILISFSGCNADNNDTSLRSGNYYAVGDYEEMLTPYLWLDTDQKTFSFGAGSVISYAERGNYAVVDGSIIATSQSTTFQFEIEYFSVVNETLHVCYRFGQFGVVFFYPKCKCISTVIKAIRIEFHFV